MSLPGYNMEHRLDKFTLKQHGYREKYIAFIDILGFSELISLTEEDPRKYRMIWEVLTQLHKSRPHKRSPELTKSGKAIDWEYIDPHMYTFSDSVVFTAYLTEIGFDFLMLALHNVCGHLLELGVLTRGAVVKGKVYDNYSIIFGPGLIDAYILESTIALQPRILIPEKIYASLSFTNQDLFRRDCDGLLHFDILRQKPQWTEQYGNVLSNDVTQDAFIRRVRKCIIKGMERNPKGNMSVFSKYCWYAQYFNAVVCSSDSLVIKPIPIKRYRTNNAFPNQALHKDAAQAPRL